MESFHPASGSLKEWEAWGFPAPEIFVWLAVAAEVGGAILLVVGLLTRPVGAILAGYFLLIIFIAHAGDPFGTREKAVLFAAISATLALTGPGGYSLDAFVQKRVSHPD